MRVLMQNRIDLWEKSGGDYIQMMETKKGLEKLGIKVDISTELSPKLDRYDLIHLYNVTRIHETYLHYRNAKQQGKKVVLSPIYHSLKEMQLFQQQGQVGLLKLINWIVPSFYLQETFKNLLRAIKDRRQTEAIIKQLITGFKTQQIEVLAGCDAWVLLAKAEGERITKELQVDNRSFVVPNGIDIDKKGKKQRKKRPFKIPFADFVLCVSRIEPRKNQLNLMKTLEGTEINLVLISGVNPNYQRFPNSTYFKEFQAKIKANRRIIWLGEVPHDELFHYYHQAHVHVNPSWFEVVSLANLEAAASGCNLVLSDVGYQREYYGDLAYYCQPGNLRSIREAVVKAFYTPKTDRLKKRIEAKFTWDITARETLKAYEKVLAQ